MLCIKVCLQALGSKKEKKEKQKQKQNTGNCGKNQIDWPQVK